MIVSTTEIKTFLGIASSDTTYDDQIAAFLPVALQDFFDYTNNYFDNNAVKIVSANIAASSTARTLTISGTNFSTWSFATGDEIRIRDSKRNDGFYNAESVSNDIITVTSSSVSVATCALRDEASGEAQMIVNKIDVPISVKPLIASMVQFKYTNPSGTPESESLGDYSVSYGKTVSGYPSGISAAMDKYRVVKFI